MAKKTIKKTVAKKAPAKAKELTAWDKVKIARDAKRPHVKDFIAGVCSDFEELHGDRIVNDDKAMVAGFGTIEGFNCLILGHNKGATIEENMESNFGMVTPDGYRKAMRLAKLAERFGNPIVTFVDTPGAYPGREAEERGQAEAIAKSLEFFSGLKTPIVVVVTGEGGSGGALAIAVGDRILMMENAVYSVISPEGCAGILWRDGARAPEAAEALKITAPELLKLGAIDEIIPEPKAGAHKNPEAAIKAVKKAVVKALKELTSIETEDLVEGRYNKIRSYGNFY